MNRKDVNIEELSPMMKQYMEIKKEHEDELLFFRLGDFYELFFEDGITASRELELTLTGKNAGLKERVPMCGVPHHAVKSYIEKLVSKGYKVAVCEQMEDPKTTKGMVKRQVVSVVSKGTISDLEFLDSHTYNYIASILDFKICYVLTVSDVSAGIIKSITIEKDNNKLLNEILKFGIKEVVIKSDFQMELLNTIKNNYGIYITISDNILDTEYSYIYEDENDPRIKEGVKHLLYYLVKRQLRDISHFDKISIVNPNDYLEMDQHTIRNLELTETIRLKERQYSLIWLIDKTKTAMGSRKLKSWLLQPLKNKNKINERYNIIEKLNNEFILKDKLRNILYEIYDIERLCGKITSNSLNARDVLQIKKSLYVLPELNEIIGKIGLSIKLNEFTELYNLLEKAIYDDPPITVHEGYLIKDGYNQELDELKSIRSGGKNFIATMENEERERTGIKTLKVGYNKVFGYYIEISKGQTSQIKPEWGFERRQTLTNGERFITPLLKEKEALILNAEERIFELEYDLFNDIREILKNNIHELKIVSDKISTLDAICSLAVVAEENSFVRPELTDKHVINLINNRHPVVESVIKGEYIPNDIIMDENTTTLLITGPNMSGKSTYMRQMAITAILAQMGSFVPAEKAIMPIFDKIFTRIGASDDLVSGESTFMVEMLEANNAISHATKDSLVLFDELGRGTATYDGMSLAESILEYVNEHIKCTTFFSTHYHELTTMNKKIRSIKNVHVKALEENGKIIFLHKVYEGAVDKSYGIHVASLAGLPQTVIERASELLKNYELKDKNKISNQEQLSLDFDEKKEEKEEKLLKLFEEINPLELTPMEALNELYNLKEKIKEWK